MPKKTPEETRERIVAMRSQDPPATYTQIIKETGVSRPVVAAVLKEAGMTRQPAEPEPPEATEDGVAELLPPKPKKTPPKVTEGECSECGTHLTIKGKIDPTDTCPECGESLA